MPDLANGKRIFEKRREYPLPEQQGVKDYVFYAVGSGDPYGAEARRFFNKHYSAHSSHPINSLESLINHLHDQINAQNLTQIREIVIVTHASAEGLILNVIDNAVAVDAKYRFVTAKSLSELQQDFVNGPSTNALQSFASKRRDVIARLSDTSWVTIRACNFGQSRPSLHALFAFFGGRANVYAPKMYMFFGYGPIAEGMRLSSKREVHQHLVKQRFLPNDHHTRDRRDALVRSLIDPGQFSAERNLITADLSDGSASTTVEYETIVDALNVRRVDSALKVRLQGARIELTAKSNVVVDTAHISWRIRDVLNHSGEQFEIEYFLSVNTFFEPELTLVVQAAFTDKDTVREIVPLQLFFDTDENNKFRGRLGILAGHSEPRSEDAGRAADFDAVLSLLDAEDFGLSSPVNILERLTDPGIALDLSESPTLHKVTSGQEWRIDDKETYLIRLERPRTTEGKQTRVLMVHEDRRQTSVAQRQKNAWMARIGTDMDQPGTELMSYLDGKSFDDLSDFIDYVRSDYKAEFAIYLHYATQAIKKKFNFFQWFNEHPITKSTKNDPLFGITFPYTTLSLSEGDDKKVAVYDFVVEPFWAEVRASTKIESFADDLFTERPFTFAANELDVPDDIEPDSPANDFVGLRAAETAGLEDFVEVDKFRIDPLDHDFGISCAQFEFVLSELKNLEGLPQAEFEIKLHETKDSEGRSLFDYLWGAYQILSAPLDFLDAAEGEGAVPDFVIRYLSKRSRLAGRVFASSKFRWLNLRAPYFLLAWSLAEMFWHFLKNQSQSIEFWRELGQLTAMRQYLRRLRVLTFTHFDNFPPTIRIDLEQYAAELRARNPLFPYLQKEYFAALYHDEELNQGAAAPSTIILFASNMKEGFDKGVTLMETQVNEIRRKAHGIFDDSMRRLGLDTCKIDVLRRVWVKNPSHIVALVMRQYADETLKQLPRV